MTTTPPSYDGRLVAAICELAERSGERLPAPAWYRGDYPAISGLDDNGDPVRGFEREVADRGAGGCTVTVWREDIHTAHGVRCGAPEVHIFDLQEEVTPDQARALAHALLEAANMAETI